MNMICMYKVIDFVVEHSQAKDYIVSIDHIHDIHHILLEINYFAKKKFLKAWLKDIRSSAQDIYTYTHSTQQTHRRDSVHAMHVHIL